MKPAPPVRFLNRLGVIAMILALALPFLFVPQAHATKKALASGAVVWTETPSAWQCVITTPSLTGGSPSATDTAYVALDLSRKLYAYGGQNGVPTVRAIYTVWTADSCAVEVWCGPTAADAAAKVYKLNALANQNYHFALGTPKINETPATYNATAAYFFPYQYLYITNRRTSGSGVVKLVITIPRPLMNNISHSPF